MLVPSLEEEEIHVLWHLQGQYFFSACEPCLWVFDLQLFKLTSTPNKCWIVLQFRMSEPAFDIPQWCALSLFLRLHVVLSAMAMMFLWWPASRLQCKHFQTFQTGVLRGRTYVEASVCKTWTWEVHASCNTMLHCHDLWIPYNSQCKSCKLFV